MSAKAKKRGDAKQRADERLRRAGERRQEKRAEAFKRAGVVADPRTAAGQRDFELSDNRDQKSKVASMVVKQHRNGTPDRLPIGTPFLR